jgi:hypothetical protein
LATGGEMSAESLSDLRSTCEDQANDPGAHRPSDFELDDLDNDDSCYSFSDSAD